MLETYLSVGPDVVEHAGNTTEALIEVVALLQWVRDTLNDESAGICLSLSSVIP